MYAWYELSIRKCLKYLEKKEWIKLAESVYKYRKILYTVKYIM